MIRSLALLFMFLPAIAFAQSEEELAAAEATHLPGLRFWDGDGALEKAGIRIVYVPLDVRPGNGRYFCSAQNPVQRTNAVKAVRSAFSRLDPEALENSELKYILLCEVVQHSGRSIGGIPVPPADLLMLSAGKNEQPSARFGLTALHEFYHFIEYKYEIHEDPEWDATFTGYMNSYGSVSPSSRIGTGGKDFLNGYAQTFAHEDRAELFAHIVMDPGAVLKQLRKSESPVLALKIETIVSRCREMLGFNACN